jgi:GPH family glycoside/pentoside/hexuronide:cation symporter
VQKGVNSLVAPVYLVALGYNPILLSISQGLLRIVDALTDNTTSRWGRRRPWMMAGLIVMVAVVAVFFFPPNVPKVGAGVTWLEALTLQWRGVLFYFLAMVGLLAVGYTMFIVPYTGMGYELTTDYNERTHLFKWRYLWFTAAGFFTPWLPWIAMQIEGDRSEVLKGSLGAQYIGVGMAVLVLMTGLLPILFCREKTHTVVLQKRVPFTQVAKSTFSNGPFLLILACHFITKFGMISTGMFFFYIFVYHIGGGNLKDGTGYLGAYFTATNVTNVVIGMMFIAWLSERVGKKSALLLCLAGSAVAYASFWFTSSNASGAFITIRAWGDQSFTLQWPSLFTAFGIGIFTNTMLMLTNSMVADVCDLDELQNGQRRDAFFGAAFTTCDKIAMALSTILQGGLLVWSGFDATLPRQSEATIAIWINVLVLTQSLGFVGGFVLILFYPLTRSRCLEVRAELDSRLGGCPPSGASIGTS